MATYFVNSNAAGTGDGSSWTNAFVSLAAAIAHPIVAGDWLWLGDNSAESYSASTTLTFPGTPANPNMIVCADHTVTTPGTGDWKTAGIVTTTVGTITAAGSFYAYGINFKTATTSTNNPSLVFAGATGAEWEKFDTCNLVIQSTGIGAITFGAGSAQSVVELLNTVCTFQETTQKISQVGSVKLFWRNTASAVAGTPPTTGLFYPEGGSIFCEGVDLSAVVNSLVHNASPNAEDYYFYNCRLASGVVGLSAGDAGPGQSTVYIVNCDSGATNYRNEKYAFEGTQTTDIVITRTGGASDGVTPVSWKLVTGTNSTFVNPFTSETIDQWNTSTGSAENVFLRGIMSGVSALPNNDQIWIEAHYLGSASYPTASFVNSTKANASATGVAVTADTSAWDSKVAARQNSHAYSLGNEITVGGGQVWFCTGAGTSASSQPGGYTSAADGSSVSDGSATFQAGVRFQLSVSITPQLIGSVFVTAKMAVQASTLWIDPLITNS